MVESGILLVVEPFFSTYRAKKPAIFFWRFTMTQLLLRLFVKNASDSHNPEVRTAIGSLSGTVGICCNLLLCGLKMLAGILSSSVSVTADALNNLSDATSSIVTLLGFRLAGKPADERHPYGHARMEYLSGLGVAVLILFIGLELAKSSISRIIHPAPVEFSLLTAGVLLGSILVKLWMFLFNRRLGNLIASTALEATAADSRNDCLSTGAVLIAGVVESVWGWQIDGFVGLGVAVFILYSGIQLAKGTISPLLGENADPQLRERIVDYVCSCPKVLGYHDLMVHDYGPGKRFATLHVEMDKDEDPLVCHELIDDMERECLQSHGVHLVIHYDPVVTNDPELDRVKNMVTVLLRVRDQRISIHDFRMTKGEHHCNLLFDVSLPGDLWGHEEAIKAALDEALNDLGPCRYTTHITFDQGAFNC